MTRSLLFIICFSFSFAVVQAQGGQNGTQGDMLKTLQEQGPDDQVTLDVDNLLVANYNKLIAKNMNSSGIRGIASGSILKVVLVPKRSSKG